ncbi:hypothetical protein G3O08_15965 [Cryomorpha ignava]|uniref:Pr6Pr family membrane protein n=1 Tax=Cryomorpha ignava TaxID=101383 RepID=A0A7K3WTI0_9FLAO|nr:Pr6Pr family membrane protein [Cryomorpha ignava]NEN24997.1 hypothetical protein [Cryomorpha ignava]
MKKTISILFAIISWFAVIAQYYLILENSVQSFAETTVRFFSYFTILTNILVALYYTMSALPNSTDRKKWINKPGVLTALTVYIVVVGLVYQVVLRQIWNPTGLQMAVDELLHTVIPLFAVLYWLANENKAKIKWHQVPAWLIYPAFYLVFILGRGHISGFFPYPFIDVSVLGYQSVMLNAAVLLGVFVVLSLVFILVGRKIARKSRVRK